MQQGFGHTCTDHFFFRILELQTKQFGLKQFSKHEILIKLNLPMYTSNADKAMRKITKIL